MTTLLVEASSYTTIHNFLRRPLEDFSAMPGTYVHDGPFGVRAWRYEGLTLGYNQCATPRALAPYEIKAVVAWLSLLPTYSPECQFRICVSQIDLNETREAAIAAGFEVEASPK